VQATSLLDMGKEVMRVDWLPDCINGQALISTTGFTYTPCANAAAAAVAMGTHHEDICEVSQQLEKVCTRTSIQ
jgi:hypothetical protein